MLQLAVVLASFEDTQVVFADHSIFEYVALASVVAVVVVGKCQSMPCVHYPLQLVVHMLLAPNLPVNKVVVKMQLLCGSD